MWWLTSVSLPRPVALWGYLSSCLPGSPPFILYPSSLRGPPPPGRLDVFPLGWHYQPIPQSQGFSDGRWPLMIRLPSLLRRNLQEAGTGPFQLWILEPSSGPGRVSTQQTLSVTQRGNEWVGPACCLESVCQFTMSIVIVIHLHSSAALPTVGWSWLSNKGTLWGF